MTLAEALKKLKAQGDAKVREQNARAGCGNRQFGVALGDIRTLAKKIRTDHAPKMRKRAVAIGEKIGLYKGWPVSKGCTPPYVPVWVDVMVNRKG